MLYIVLTNLFRVSSLSPARALWNEMFKGVELITWAIVTFIFLAMLYNKERILFFESGFLTTCPPESKISTIVKIKSR